jgi:hypothetical protein
MGFQMNDGRELEVGPGEAFDVQPGHDSWTIGTTSVVFIDMIGAVQSGTTIPNPHDPSQVKPQGSVT